MKKIFVTKSFLPPKEEYVKYIDGIYERVCLTNQGPLLAEFERKMSEYLSVKNFQYVVNGTAALELALDALKIEEGEIITTPFSYVATTTAILWRKLKPVFADIEPRNFTLDPTKIESLITEKTKAIMPVHVFGYACDTQAIQKVADKYNLKVIYDGAHAFASKYKGKSLLDYGDISTLSFHATKLFHTIEGGACIIKDDTIAKYLHGLKTFGHKDNEYFQIGVNAKATEFSAAMGLANYPYIDAIIAERKRISEMYDDMLGGLLIRPAPQHELEYNYAYYPVVFKNEDELVKVFEELEKNGIYARRYFYPSLNRLPYLDEVYPCPISEDISLRVACLPLYVGLQETDVVRICGIIKNSLG